MPITITINGREYETRAELDTGSKWSLSLCRSEPFVQSNFDQLASLGTRYGRMASGQHVKNKVVVLDRLTIGGLAMTDVQADLEYASRDRGLAFNILGNDFLRRFDLIIDYQQSELHLKPNGLRNEAYNTVFGFAWFYWVGGTIVVGIAGALSLLIWRRRRQAGSVIESV